MIQPMWWGWVNYYGSRIKIHVYLFHPFVEGDGPGCAKVRGDATEVRCGYSRKAHPV